jgi:hypothetical protein
VSVLCHSAARRPSSQANKAKRRRRRISFLRAGLVPAGPSLARLRTRLSDELANAKAITPSSITNGPKVRGFAWSSRRPAAQVLVNTLIQHYCLACGNTGAPKAGLLSQRTAPGHLRLAAKSGDSASGPCLQRFSLEPLPAHYARSPAAQFQLSSHRNPQPSGQTVHVFVAPK